MKRFLVQLEARVAIDVDISAEDWESAVAQAKKMKVIDHIPTPETFAFADSSDTTIRFIQEG